MEVNINEIKRIKSLLNNTKLIAATKYVGIEEMIDLYKADIHYFGENKVQDFLKKYETFPYPVHWHFIGTLQPNKVKYIIDKVELIHSVDSIKLLDEIEKQASKHQIIMPILLQVNISKEETKHGFDQDEIVNICKYIDQNLPHVCLHGLMTMAPYIDQEKTRPIFQQTKELLQALKEKFPQFPFNELSMGMSNDFEIAIEEGSTMVRIGSRLFVK